MEHKRCDGCGKDVSDSDHGYRDHYIRENGKVRTVREIKCPSCKYERPANAIDLCDLDD